MSDKAKPARDAYRFSLGGAAAINSFAFVPANPDDAIRVAPRTGCGHPSHEQPGFVRDIEDFLARFFAAGCRSAA